MRTILILLLTINTAFAICDTQTIENVSECTLNDRLEQLVMAVRPNFHSISHKKYFAEDPCTPIKEVTCPQTCTTIDMKEKCVQDDLKCVPVRELICKPWNPSFQTFTWSNLIIEDVKVRHYENLIIEPVLPLVELTSELNEWKAKEITRITYWNRLEAIKDMRTSMVKCNLNQPNSAIFKRDIKKALDETKLACLESKQTEITTEKEAKKAKKEKKEKAKEKVKKHDCSKEKGFVQDLCESMQG